MREYERRGVFETVAISKGAELSSNSTLGAADIPASILTPPAESLSEPVHVTAMHHHYTVVSGAIRGSRTRLYFFFERDELLGSLRDVRNVLGIGWLVTIGAAALFGAFVARQTLRPVANVAKASCDLAERLTGVRPDPPDNDEFGTLTVAFNEMAAAVSDKIARLSEMAERERRFTADVAHELRTPLTAMTSLAIVLTDRIDDVPIDMRRSVELLTASVDRLRTLVVDLLELARVDAEPERVQLVPVSVPVEVQRCLEERRIETDAHFAGDPRALADRRCLRRVITNVIDNAQRHAGGVTQIRVLASGDVCTVEIDDAGPGIPPDEIDAIFNRFHKVDPARSSQGSGLGLAIARDYARMQGGTLRATNLERGARFVLTLHRVEGEPTTRDTPALASFRPDTAAATSRGG